MLCFMWTYFCKFLIVSGGIVSNERNIRVELTVLIVGHVELADFEGMCFSSCQDCLKMFKGGYRLKGVFCVMFFSTFVCLVIFKIV